MPKVLRLKREVWEILASTPDLPSLHQALEAFPPSRLVSPLIGAFCHRDERVRWRAILALGPVVARIAEKDLEAARVVIRRLMWMLNEESGGMAWGVPEALAECLYHHPVLAQEYTSILVSYLRPDGNLLSYPPAQRGVAWGIGRLSEKEREALLELRAPVYLLPVLSSPDKMAAGLAAWSMGRLSPEKPPEDLRSALAALREVSTEVFFFDGQDLRWHKVGELATEALRRIYT